VAITEIEILDYLNKHMIGNWPRGGHWRAKGAAVEFVDRESGQVLTAMPTRKAALLAGATTETDRILCLSLHQPWASLIAIGAKRYETRGWPTSHRGPLAIHAAKAWTRDQAALCLKEPFRSALEAGGIKIPLAEGRYFLGRKAPAFLPLGAVVAVGNVVDCFETFPGPPGLDHVEEMFGDWGPGRWAWLLEDVRPLAEPSPLAGAQGLFAIRPKPGGGFERAGGRWDR